MATVMQVIVNGQLAGQIPVTLGMSLTMQVVHVPDAPAPAPGASAAPPDPASSAASPPAAPEAAPTPPAPQAPATPARRPSRPLRKHTV